jgi:hypothetical protein
MSKAAVARKIVKWIEEWNESKRGRSARRQGAIASEL